MEEVQKHPCVFLALGNGQLQAVVEELLGKQGGEEGRGGEGREGRGGNQQSQLESKHS